MPNKKTWWTMKLKYYYVLLLISSFSFSYSIDILKLFDPIIPLVVGTVRCFTCLSDYFMPATQKELLEVKQEIKRIVENNALKMQEYSQKNIQQSYEATKEDFKKTVEPVVNLLYKKSDSIKIFLRTTEKIIASKIEKNHDQRLRALKKNLNDQGDSTQKKLDELINKLTHSHNKEAEVRKQCCNNIISLLINLKRKLNDKKMITHQVLKNTTEEHKNILTKHHEERKKEKEHTQKKCSAFFAETHKKLDTLERLCCIFKGRLNEQKRKQSESHSTIYTDKAYHSLHLRAFNTRYFAHSLCASQRK